MLSIDEKQEMREDGEDRNRRDRFRAVKEAPMPPLSFDECLRFLNQVQDLFSPFEISRRITRTEHNRL